MIQPKARRSSKVGLVVPNAPPHRVQLSTPSGRLRTAIPTLFFALLTLFLTFSANAQSEPDATQTIELRAGWNLISIQVGAGITPAQFQTSLGIDDASKLRAIWGFETPGITGSAPWQWKFHRTDPGHPNDLALLEPGKGYWVDVASACTATLSGPPSNTTLSLNAGWNLVGFSGLYLNDSELQQLPDIFGDAFDRITQVWKWDTATQRHIGYDIAAIPQVNDLEGVEPGCGYWVYALEPVTLSPEPFIALPADSDVPAPQPSEAFMATDTRFTGADSTPYVGRQVRFRNSDGSDDAYDLNDNGILDDPETQDTILFEKTAGTSTITIGNRGAGVVTWSLENNINWLFTTAPDERAYPENEDRPRSATGTVSAENDLIILYVDRRGMNPGRSGPETMSLWVAGEEHVIEVMADVADISGDWSGFASTKTVNGQDVSLGEVRLAVNAFLKDGQTEGSGFRAVVDREKAILFPRDVFLEGVFYSEKDFQLTTNFEMPAGDRNAPPYATFPGDPDDRDFDGDGRVGVMNPFPYGLRREVTLLGTRVSPDRLEGTYVESIRGMLPPLNSNTLTSIESEFVSESFLTTSQPVIIQGEFVLERESFEPTKRSVFNETTSPETPIGGTDTQVRTVTIDVGTSFSVQGVTLAFDLDFPDPALMRIILISPDPSVAPYVIHNFGDATLPDANTLIPDVFQSSQGFGEWRLQIEWDTSERGTLHSWGLNLEGVSTHHVTGRIVESSVPVVGAALRLEGSVQPRTDVSAADGTFDIDEITENDYTLFISKPGYLEKAVTFFIAEVDVTLGDIELSPLTVTEPELRAAPTIGFQPLHTDLTMLKPIALAVDEIVWSFDDGTPDVSGSLDDFTTVDHRFSKAGVFTVTAILKNTGSTVDTLTIPIHVHRTRSDSTLAQNQIVSSTFIGALSARTDAAANVPTATPVPDAGQLHDYDNSDPAVPSATVYQETKWDVGTVDIDRLPLRPDNNTFNSNAEDTDFSGQTYVFYDAVEKKFKTRPWQSGDPTTDLSPEAYTVYEIPDGRTKPDRFRMSTTIGGAIFSLKPQSLGPLTVHPGRTLK